MTYVQRTEEILVAPLDYRPHGSEPGDSLVTSRSESDSKGLSQAARILTKASNCGASQNGVGLGERRSYNFVSL